MKTVLVCDETTFVCVKCLMFAQTRVCVDVSGVFIFAPTRYCDQYFSCLRPGEMSVSLVLNATAARRGWDSVRVCV